MYWHIFKVDTVEHPKEKGEYKELVCSFANQYDDQIAEKVVAFLNEIEPSMTVIYYLEFHDWN